MARGGAKLERTDEARADEAKAVEAKLSEQELAWLPYLGPERRARASPVRDGIERTVACALWSRSYSSACWRPAR